MTTAIQRDPIPQALRVLSLIEGVKWVETGGGWVSTETVQRLAHEAIAELLRDARHANAAPKREAVPPAGETGS